MMVGGRGLLWGISALCLLATGASAATSVQFTYVPPYGSFDNLQGRVYGLNPAAYQVAVFIHVGGVWWSKPTCSAGYTVPVSIQSNGTWVADITTGGTDQNATQIAAYVVPVSYFPPCVLGTGCLPDVILQQSVANTIATRIPTGTRGLHWSGLDWTVKTSASPVGPGPNFFSDSTNNVAVDDQGRLHLRITHTGGNWYCPEIVSLRTLGYGNYVFRVDGTPTDLDPNIILGLFTWSDATNQNHREIDVEYARWSSLTDSNNSQFTVQPAPPSHFVRYRIPPVATNSISSFNWQTNTILFLSATGTSSSASTTNVVLNPSFESGSGTLTANSWTLFNNAYRTPTNSGGGALVTALDGIYSMKTYGPFGGTLNASGASQIITNASPGQVWRFSGFALNWSSDPLSGTEGYGVAQLTFLNAASNNLQTVDSPHYGTGTPQNQWQSFQVTATAPASTVAVQVQVLHVGRVGNGGSVWWENLSAAPAPDPNALAQWTYTDTIGIPASCDENVRLNFWLNNGNPPLNGLESEVVVTKFEFKGTDTDSDGMPDWWERAHSLGLNDPNDAETDDDGDGFTNLQEYLAGTDPANPVSALRITAIDTVGADARISFSSAADRDYDVETTPNLQPISWGPVTQKVAGTGAAVQLIDLGGATNAPSRFYQIRLVPQ
jgi:hypothetical protein